MSAVPDRPDVRAALRSLQLIWLSIIGLVVLVGVAVPVVAEDPGSTVPVWLPVVLVLVVGLGAAGAMLVLDHSFAATPPVSDHAAAGQFRTRVFLAAALTEFPALLSVAVAVVVGPPWVATVGAAAAAIGLLVARPSEATIDRYDAAWRQLGADVSVRRGLLGTTPGGHP